MAGPTHSNRNFKLMKPISMKEGDYIIEVWDGANWNDDTKSYDTIYEDSYDYDGPMDYAQGDEDFDFRELKEVMKDLGAQLKKSMKKAIRSGASEYKK